MLIQQAIELSLQLSAATQLANESAHRFLGQATRVRGFAVRPVGLAKVSWNFCGGCREASSYTGVV